MAIVKQGELTVGKVKFGPRNEPIEKPIWPGYRTPSAHGLRQPGFYGKELMEFLRGLELEEETLP